MNAYTRIVSKQIKPTDSVYKHKLMIGFTTQQHETLQKLEQHGVNINQFIRQAIKEKIQKEWKEKRLRRIE